MIQLQWVDEVPPVDDPGRPGPSIVYYLFDESSPLDLEALPQGAEATAELGGREIRLTKVQTKGRPWRDPETDTRITTFRASQLGFTAA